MLLAVCVGGLAAWSLVFVTPSWSATLLLIGSVYVLWLRKYDLRWTLRRKYRRLKGIENEREWTFTEDRIVVKSDDGESSLGWSSLVKWVETPRGFLVYPQEDIYLWFPFSAFDSDNDVSALRNLAKRRIERFERVA